MGKYPYFPKVNSTWNKKQKFDSISIKEITTPDNPDSDYEKLYFKADGKLYKLNSSGTEAVAVEGISTAQANAIIANTAKISLDDNSVTVAKLAHGTANKYLGFDASGNPAELTVSAGGIDTGAYYLNDISEFPASPVLDYNFTVGGRRNYFVTQVSPFMKFRDSRDASIGKLEDDLTSYTTDAQVKTAMGVYTGTGNNGYDNVTSQTGNHTDNRIDSSGDTSEGVSAGHTLNMGKCMYQFSTDNPDRIAWGYDMKYRFKWTYSTQGSGVPYNARYIKMYMGAGYIHASQTAPDSTNTPIGLELKMNHGGNYEIQALGSQTILSGASACQNIDFWVHQYSDGVTHTFKLYSNEAMTSLISTKTSTANKTTRYRGFGTGVLFYQTGTTARWHGNYQLISLSVGSSDY